jgi:uncharacterized protein DUF6516
LYSYLTRLESILYSRKDISIEDLQTNVRMVIAGFNAIIRFQNDSKLVVMERLKRIRQRDFERTVYRFHYQQPNGTLIFRYDNSPHYPQLATFPAHKHVGDVVIAAEPPDLADVLHEIDEILYPGTNQ